MTVYDAPRLRALLTDDTITKLFHFARFDVGMLHRWLGVTCRPVYFTKIASRLVRTYTDRHGLKELCRELLGIELSKEQQSSDWAAPTLSPEQLKYAASDVLWLHRLRQRLDEMLVREGRTDLAQACSPSLSIGHASITKARRRRHLRLLTTPPAKPTSVNVAGLERELLSPPLLGGFRATPPPPRINHDEVPY